MNITQNGKNYLTKIFIVIVVGIIIVANIYKYRFGMDMIVVSFAVVAISRRETMTFVKDWFPPIFLFYLYEFLRARAYSSVAVPLNREIIVQPLIDLERKLFFFLDEVPSVKLQYWLRPELDKIHWYDYVLFFFYVMFFWYWLVVGLILWLKNRSLLRKYLYGLAAFSLIDVVIYAFFPSAPPWYAADHGLIPWISRIMWTTKYLPSDTISYVNTYGNNDFAAFPSHHAAWPFFATLFLVKLYGKKALPAFIIPFTIAFATWYGAEHYVIDSIAGFIVAGITFWIMINWNRILKLFKRKLNLQNGKKSPKKSSRRTS